MVLFSENSSWFLNLFPHFIMVSIIEKCEKRFKLKMLQIIENWFQLKICFWFLKMVPIFEKWCKMSRIKTWFQFTKNGSIFFENGSDSKNGSATINGSICLKMVPNAEMVYNLKLFQCENGSSYKMVPPKQFKLKWLHFQKNSIF